MWHVVLIVGGWTLVGVLTAIAMQRRGHDLRSLLGLGIVLGPLFLPLAMEFVRHREPSTAPIRVSDAGGEHGGRGAYVLVLGEPETAADAIPVLRLIDDLGAVMLIGIIDFESAHRPAWDDAKSEASAHLQRAAVILQEFAPGQALAAGRIDAAVASLPLRPDDVVLVVGDGGKGELERAGNAAGVPLIRVPASPGPS